MERARPRSDAQLSEATDHARAKAATSANTSVTKAACRHLRGLRHRRRSAPHDQRTRPRPSNSANAPAKWACAPYAKTAFAKCSRRSHHRRGSHRRDDGGRELSVLRYGTQRPRNMALFGFPQVRHPRRSPAPPPQGGAPADGGPPAARDRRRMRPISTSPSARRPPLRLNGRLVKLQLRRAHAPKTPSTLARAITSEANLQRVNEEGSVDFGFSFRERGSFPRQRLSAERAPRSWPCALVPRKRMLSLDEIGLPPAVHASSSIRSRAASSSSPAPPAPARPPPSPRCSTRHQRHDTEGHIITIEDPDRIRP